MYLILRSMLLWIGIVSITVGYFGFAVLHALLGYEETRRVGHGWARRWAKSIVFLNSAWQITVDDKRLPKGKHFVIVSNHQSTGDIIVHLHLDHHYKFISRQSNFKWPIMGWYMTLAGYIPLERGKKSSIAACMARARWYLDRGVSVLFYPEGTRSTDGTVKPFKRGAFQLAIEAGVDVLPIALSSVGELLPANSVVFSKDKKPIFLVVGEPISVAGMGPDDVQRLSDMARQAVIELNREAEARTAQRLKEGFAA